MGQSFFVENHMFFFRMRRTAAGMPYIPAQISAISTGRPIRWLPNTCSNHTKGEPSDGRAKKKKFVPKRRFTRDTGTHAAATQVKQNGSRFQLGRRMFRARRTPGTITSSPCRKKLCRL